MNISCLVITDLDKTLASIKRSELPVQLFPTSLMIHSRLLRATVKHN